jgi:putative nucleotidyltransferase with HDIG domain
MEREKAFNLLLKYNKEKYHIQHALTVEEVMKWYAKELGYDADYWGIVGLLHDLDFEVYPQEHCVKVIEILKSENYGEDIIRAVCSHGYNVTVDVQPEHEMEKVLYAVDELTGIIFAAAKMRPSKSVSDMELSSLKKKFKDKAFAAGCSRDIIRTGAEMLGWDLDKLLNMTLEAMRATEDIVLAQVQNEI